jgi:hypothetical protein
MSAPIGAIFIAIVYDQVVEQGNRVRLGSQPDVTGQITLRPVFPNPNVHQKPSRYQISPSPPHPAIIGKIPTL